MPVSDKPEATALRKACWASFLSSLLLPPDSIIMQLLYPQGHLSSDNHRHDTEGKERGIGGTSATSILRDRKDPLVTDTSAPTVGAHLAL